MNNKKQNQETDINSLSQEKQYILNNNIESHSKFYNYLSSLFLSILFILNITWFYGLSFKTIMGDDLQRWFFFHSTHSFMQASILNHAGNKYRPVFDIIQYFQFKLFNAYYQLFFYFNIIFNFLIIIVLYRLILRISKNKIIAFFSCLIYLTSRFSYYNILQLNGILEAFSLFLLLLIIYFSEEFFIKNQIKYLYGILILNFLLIFTDERYIIVIFFLFALILINNFMTKQKKCIMISLASLPLLLNIFLKVFVFHIIFFEGTGGTVISVNLISIMKYLIAGFLNILGISYGPAFLVGVSVQNVNFITLLFSASIVFIILLIFYLYLSRVRKLDLIERNQELKIALLWAILFIPLLLSASITIHQELRWLYAPYVVFIIYVAYLFSKISWNINVKYIILACLCFFVIHNDIYYKKYLPNIFFVYSQQTSDSVYEETIEKYGTELANYKIYIENDKYLDWPLQGNMFFIPYLDEESNFKVNYYEDIENLDLINNDENRTIILKYDNTLHKFQNVTQDAFLEKNILPSIAVKYNFTKEYNKGYINSRQKVPTPTGLGSLLMDWSTELTKRKTLTIVSGYSYSYNDIDIGINDQLRFLLLMPLHIGDGARAFVDIVYGSKSTRVYNSDLDPKVLYWQKVDIPLSNYSGKKVDVVFGTESPSGDPAGDWIAFGDPIIGTPTIGNK